MKILILGSTGKLGTALKKAYSGEDVIGLSSKDVNLLGDGALDKLRALLIMHSPAVVFNCAGLIGIDVCEDNPKDAFWMNAVIPQELSRWSNELLFSLVHFSTDAVFHNSQMGGRFTEQNQPRPVNVYGATKLAGEHLVMAENPNALIIRTSVLFGPTNSSPQFVEKMLALVDKQGFISVADDIICSPSYSIDVADRARLMVSNMDHGLYHVVNSSNKTSLYRLMTMMLPDSDVRRGSHKDFPHTGRKNTDTPMLSCSEGPCNKYRTMPSLETAVYNYRETLND